MFAFHPCDRCRYYNSKDTFCVKHFNQFKTNERYLTAASKSKVIHIPNLCYKFVYQKEPILKLENLLYNSSYIQPTLF